MAPGANPALILSLIGLRIGAGALHRVGTFVTSKSLSP
jgi:hypothetical protein